MGVEAGDAAIDSYRQHAVASLKPVVVSDAREHLLLRNNGAIREIGAIAYAGVPLVGSDGLALGTLCVIDRRRREWSADEVALLGEIAEGVVQEIERGSVPPGDDH